MSSAMLNQEGSTMLPARCPSSLGRSRMDKYGARATLLLAAKDADSVSRGSCTAQEWIRRS